MADEQCLTLLSEYVERVRTKVILDLNATGADLEER